MKLTPSIRRGGFTLLETVIAIGVLAVLLTGFLVVFTPAAEGISRAIGVQQVDRLTATLERELVNLRRNDLSSLASSASSSSITGFDKAFEWIKESGTNAQEAVFIYQYRGDNTKIRTDGTPEPQVLVKDKLSGKDFSVVSIARRRSDPSFLEDLPAIEGPLYLVKCTQLIFADGELRPGEPGTITSFKNPGENSATSTAYKEAVIAFAAEFHAMPSKDRAFYSGGAFDTRFQNLKRPVFTQNLAVRR